VRCFVGRELLKNDWFQNAQSTPVISCLRSSKRGAVAQLGERLNGIQEVVGSTPIGSTNKIPGSRFSLRVQTEFVPEDAFRKQGILWDTALEMSFFAWFGRMSSP
jgi:hypothetical protein